MLSKTTPPTLPSVTPVLPRGTVRRSLVASMGDGVFAALMMGAVDSFLLPFGLALRATSAQLAWLTSLPGLLGALAQWWTGLLTRRWGGRKPVLLLSVGAQAACLAGLAVMTLGTWSWRFPAVVILVMGYVAFGGLSGPVWNSLMTEYLPPGRRAGYFGWRNRITGTIVIVAMLGAGMVLQRFGVPLSAVAGTGTSAVKAFSFIFGFAFLCRLVSLAYLGRMHEPAVSRRVLPWGDFAGFRAATRGGAYWRFVTFAAGLTFAANLSGPYFPVYMLQGLGYSYMTYVTVMVALNIALSAAMAPWGRQADHAGTLRVLRLSAWLTPTLPALWLLGDSPAYVCGVQLFGGVVWSGVNLVTTNYIFDAVPPRLRTQGVSYFNVINGAALFAGAFLGGHLLDRMPPLLGHRFLALLAVSGVLRVLACLALLPRVPPVRADKDVSHWEMFAAVTGLKPAFDFCREAVTGFGRTGA